MASTAAQAAGAAHANSRHTKKRKRSAATAIVQALASGYGSGDVRPDEERVIELLADTLTEPKLRALLAACGVDPEEHVRVAPGHYSREERRSL